MTTISQGEGKEETQGEVRLHVVCSFGRVRDADRKACQTPESVSIFAFKCLGVCLFLSLSVSNAACAAPLCCVCA